MGIVGRYQGQFTAGGRHAPSSLLLPVSCSFNRRMHKASTVDTPEHLTRAQSVAMLASASWTSASQTGSTVYARTCPIGIKPASTATRELGSWRVVSAGATGLVSSKRIGSDSRSYLTELRHRW